MIPLYKFPKKNKPILEWVWALLFRFSYAKLKSRVVQGFALHNL